MAIEMARIYVVRMASIHLTDISCCKNLWSKGNCHCSISVCFAIAIAKHIEMEQWDLWVEYAHRAMAVAKHLQWSEGTMHTKQRNNAHKGTMHTAREQCT